MDEWPRRSLTVARSTPFSSRRLAWLWRTVWRLAPLGSPRSRHIRDTVPEIESGFNGVPFGFEVLDDPVEVHVTPPSRVGRCTRAATANLAGSGSSAGSTGQRSSLSNGPPPPV